MKVFEALANVNIEPVDVSHLPPEFLEYSGKCLRDPYAYRTSKGNYLLGVDLEHNWVYAWLLDNPDGPVGMFKFNSNGSTLSPNDDDGTTAIMVNHRFQRQGLATAMIKYAMKITNTKEFVRSEIETDAGKEFFPTIQEKSGFTNSNKNGYELSPTQLSGIHSLKAITALALRKLPIWGEGASRIVFQFSDTMLLKVAKQNDGSGIDQNALEARIAESGVDVVPHVFYCDPHYRFLIVEKAGPISDWDYDDRTGKRINNLRLFLLLYSELIFGREYSHDERSSYTPQDAKRVIDDFLTRKLVEMDDFTKGCLYLVKEFDLLPRDIRSGNIGLVERDNQWDVVILDAGFSPQVAEMNWSGIRVPASKWDTPEGAPIEESVVVVIEEDEEEEYPQLGQMYRLLLL